MIYRRIAIVAFIVGLIPAASWLVGAVLF